MSESIKRIELPSDGWWEIETRPRWKHLRNCENETEWDTLERALDELSTAWSFPEEISRASIQLRSNDDLRAVLEVLDAALAQYIPDNGFDESPEKLFAGMMAGQIPPAFAEVHVMAMTGWGWQELQDTPADVVQRMMMYLSVRQARDVEGALVFDDREGE